MSTAGEQVLKLYVKTIVVLPQQENTGKSNNNQTKLILIYDKTTVCNTRDQLRNSHGQGVMADAILIAMLLV
jgi:hypothetical protein